MKKSEMIKTITEYLQGETNHPYSKALAVTILDMCEDAGMLPPETGFDYGDPDHSWEKEV